MIRHKVCAAGALLIAFAASGCGMLGGGEAGSLESMLERVPSNADNRTQLIYGNLARLRGEGDPAKDDKAEMKALLAKSRGTYVIADPVGQNLLREGFAKEAGFGIRDIDASIEAGRAPKQLSLFEGRFDAGAIDTALTKNASFAKETKTGELAGVKTYSVGEDGTLNLRAQSPFRPIGQALRIGVTDSGVWLTRTDAVLGEALEVADGDGTSLADDDRYAEVAKAVDDANAFNAVVIGDPRSYTVDAAGMAGRRATPEAVERFQELVDAGKLGLAPWQVAALADVPGELVVVLRHADGAAAKDNLTRLTAVVKEGESTVTGEPWSDRLRFTSINVDGDLLVARLETEVPMAYRLFTTRDNLIMIAKK